jgi:DNA-binding HxlR family transcriptional regulator
MKDYRPTSVNCKSTMKLLGDYWTLRIIDALHQDDARFCELQRSVDNLNPVTLTARLKKLEDADLVRRVEDLEDKVSVTYSLTKLGLEAIPVIKALDRFSEKAAKK